jgi:hypothetical protein
MARPCSIPGCTGHTTQWGSYCPTHAAQARRHGHPEQRAVTKAELRPFERRALERVDLNAGNPLWAGVEANWRGLGVRARGILTDFRAGRAGSRHERIAAEEVLKLAEHIEPAAFLITGMAMFLMQEADPHRFRSDDAFRFQLTRRVRGLSEVNAGTWTDRTTGRRKLVYRELPPKAAAVLARWFIETLAGVGVLVARLEHQQRQERLRRAESMAEGARALV